MRHTFNPISLTLDSYCTILSPVGGFRVWVISLMKLYA